MADPYEELGGAARSKVLAPPPSRQRRHSWTRKPEWRIDCSERWCERCGLLRMPRGPLGDRRGVSYRLASGRVIEGAAPPCL